MLFVFLKFAIFETINFHTLKTDIEGIIKIGYPLTKLNRVSRFKLGIIDGFNTKIKSWGLNKNTGKEYYIKKKHLLFTFPISPIGRTIPFIFIILLISCTKEIKDLNENIELKHNFKVVTEKDQVNFDLGIWMFKDMIADKNYIANWLNTRHDSKSILEPINIIWIDLKAKDKTEASNNVVQFLKQNGFVNRRYSSTGYSSFFDNIEWIPQYPETWSDKADPRTINNHGRIFLAHKTSSKSNNLVFVSSGAFSIESETHAFISFKNSLKQFNEVSEWRIYKNNLDIGNIIQTTNYSTFDHEGVIVFILN